MTDDLRRAAERIVLLLVEGDYAAAEAATVGRLSAADLRLAVEQYGRTLVDLPAQALEPLEVIEILGMPRPTFHVVVDLWTAEEGLSDLSLELCLTARADHGFDIEIENLHTL